MMELNEKQFIAGFNSGYLLAKFEPNLSTSLLNKISPVNSYISGMIFGQKQWEQNHSKHKLDELKQIRQNKMNEREI